MSQIKSMAVDNVQNFEIDIPPSQTYRRYRIQHWSTYIVDALRSIIYHDILLAYSSFDHPTLRQEYFHSLTPFFRKYPF